MKPVKVFCIGFHKTGTNSLGEALTQLGYKVCGVRHDLLPFLKSGNYTPLDLVVNEYDAFKDNPWPVLFRVLDERYPGSKFIMTIREESSWIKSIVNHFNETPSDMIQYIYGVSYPKHHEEIFLSRYRQHLQEVNAYFKSRSQDVLVLHLPDDQAWNKICAFLQEPVPDASFPHVNKGAYTFLGKLMKKISKRIRGRIRSFRNPDA